MFYTQSSVVCHCCLDSDGWYTNKTPILSNAVVPGTWGQDPRGMTRHRTRISRNQIQFKNNSTFHTLAIIGPKAKKKYWSLGFWFPLSPYDSQTHCNTCTYVIKYISFEMMVVMWPLHSYFEDWGLKSLGPPGLIHKWKSICQKTWSKHLTVSLVDLWQMTAVSFFHSRHVLL